MGRCDFTIVSKPVGIRFICPICEGEIEKSWDEIHVPDCWSDTWEPVECPECHNLIELDGWDYD